MAGKFRLTDLDLDEISLVPAGDDPEAKVVLAKNAPLNAFEMSDSITRINLARIRKARDGDGDGMVHDGTPRQRPARPSEKLKGKKGMLSNKTSTVQRRKRATTPRKKKGMFSNRTETIEWRKEGRESVRSGQSRSRQDSTRDVVTRVRRKRLADDRTPDESRRTARPNTKSEKQKLTDQRVADFKKKNAGKRSN